MDALLKDKTEIKRFNIRVYGLVVNLHNEVLLCNETYQGHHFTKFPGGGLEFGEGIIDCLHREFKEELKVPIEVLGHFYTTDFFQASAFLPSDQIISIYYRVKLLGEITLGKINYENHSHDFFWLPAAQLDPSHVNLPIDKIVIQSFQKSLQHA